jgi:hypothetical protein
VLPFFVVKLSQQCRHIGIPPLPVTRLVDESLARRRLDEGPILGASTGASATLDTRHTRSKAAIFFFGAAGGASLNAAGVPGGTYFPTMREVGVSSFTDLSDQVIGSGGFWELGLKNEETALSTFQLGSKFHTPLLLGPGLTCSRRLDLPFDRGW